jgi:radical SAM superfamily enzyme YgiQ (UPF0313 family)
MPKKILFGANHSIIEPLGLLHLSTVAKEEGYDPQIMLARDGNFDEMLDEVRRQNPEYVGVQSFTGNHREAFDFLEAARSLGAKTIIGGPHPTYFPKESEAHADYVVISEGFNSLRRILRGDAEEGIVALVEKEPFPQSDREQFYRDSPVHRDNPIKSLITKTGCPFSCTYCYNSSNIDLLRGILSDEDFDRMEAAIGNGGRLFANSQRSVQDVLDEISGIRRMAPATKMIYFQDDVFGADLNWLEEFAQKFDCGIGYHAQMRFEAVNPDTAGGRSRLDLLKSSGCTGLTFAIESADPIVRREVLNRRMDQSLIFEALDYVGHLGLPVRTEQMLGLPLGATKVETPINIEADIETLRLNVELKQKTGRPDLAWASIFVPYVGTRLAKYSADHGFSDLNMADIPASFFESSTLKFPNRWVGPSLSTEDPSLWLSDSDQERHRKDLFDLRTCFSTFAQIPKGDELARDFLSQPDRSLVRLDKLLKGHSFDRIIYGTK